MTDSPKIQPAPTPTRSEKLQAIAAVFGTDMAARLGAAPDDVSRSTGSADPDRLAWQTNRLIRHLRDRVGGTASAPPTPSGVRTGPAAASAPFRRSDSMPTLAAGDDLAQEHPAVIAHLLRPEGQEVRVAVLRALPGHLARDVMRRLKTP
jgi:hypothetical protein